MWLFTKAGFFSVVDKEGDGNVCIRSRLREDLETLCTDYLTDPPSIIENSGTDYPYRIYLPKPEWVSLAAVLADEVDYSNFKNEISRLQGYERAHLYGDVWSVLYGAERKIKGKRSA